MAFKRTRCLLFLFIILITHKGYCQEGSPTSLHERRVASPTGHGESSKRPWKTSIEAGLVFGLASPAIYTVHYVSGMSASTGYTLGLMEEIPFQTHSYVDIGVELLGYGISFNSYFFEPGYSFLYNGDFKYNHSISMNEIQVPLLYKFLLGPRDHKNRSLYATLGAKFRYISYSYTTITDNTTGDLVWSGLRDVTSRNKLFSPFGSSILEASIGYQRDTKKKRIRGWYMNLEYDYGFSPFVYSGDKEGSNYILFHYNTLIFKIGKIF